MRFDFICIRQQRLTDCGAACLATVAQTYQQNYSLATLRQLIPADAQGATVLALVQAAQKCGFEAHGLFGGLPALAQVALPCIAHLHGIPNDHFVVLHQYDDQAGMLVVADPAQGLLRYALPEFAQRWSGVLISLQPTWPHHTLPV
jgi:ABC-type bacteriocin/lantibiotic exporter with double-glycine peptidase domain